jgi:hypothetical protein
MIIPEDKQYLLSDLYLNPQTSCSREEAVGIMLNVFNIGWGVMLEQMSNDEEVGDDYEFNIYDYLNGERAKLQNAFVDAKLDDAPEVELLGYLDKIEEFDTNYMKKAQIYWCAIADELARGEQSELRTNEDGNITITSLNAWYKETSVFKQMQAIPPEVDTNSNETKAIKIKSINVDFGILLGAFAAQFETKTDKETAISFAIETAKKIDLEAVEVQKIAEMIHAIMYEKGVSEETPKHEVGTIADRLSNAKRDALQYLNDPKNKC